MPAPVRVGLAGFGAWGRMHALALSRIPEARLAAIFAHGDEAASAAAESWPAADVVRSYEALLAVRDLDAIIVAVPNDLHASFATKALEAGRHVILEKPLGVSLAECRAVAAAAAAAGRQVVVNHELRVSRQWGEVRRLIAAGEIGRVRHQHLSLFRRPFRPGSGGWRKDPARVGSWLLEELVHFLDLLLWYGAENGQPARLVAQGSGRSGLIETISVMLDWPDGSTALVTQCLAGFEHHTLLEISGEEGAIRTWWAGSHDRTETPCFALSAKRRGDAEAEPIPVERSGEVFELEENLRRALASFRGAPPALTLADAQAAVALCLAAEDGLRSGQPVDLAAWLS